jgi:hypothetical protein
MSHSRGPLFIAIVLLLLPVLYVGSYLALVVPRGVATQPNLRRSSFTIAWRRYRLGGQASEFLFWPLEQIDRKLRPGTLVLDLPPVDGWKNGIPFIPASPAKST